MNFEFSSRWYGGIVLLSLNLLFPLTGAQPILSTPLPLLNAQTPSDADASPEESEPERQVLIAEVVLRGAEGEIAEEIYRVIRTKAGETTTRSQLREDINAIFALGYFRNARALPEDTEIGVRVTFEVELNPVLRQVEVKFLPETATQHILPQTVLDEIFEPQYNRVLNVVETKESLEKLTQWYQDRGYVLAKVAEPPKIEDDGTLVLTLAEGVIEAIDIKLKGDREEETPEETIDESSLIEAMQLQVGSVFNRDLAKQDLQEIQRIGGFQDVQLNLDPGEDSSQVVVIINITQQTADEEIEAILEEAKELEKQDWMRQQAIASSNSIQPNTELTAPNPHRQFAKTAPDSKTPDPKLDRNLLLVRRR